jgi:hypothetical protein
MKETRPSLDDVYRLSFGKPSQGRFGSRSIQHRLNKIERRQFESARSLGLLYATRAVNPALVNTYYNFCVVARRDFVSLVAKNSEFTLTVISTGSDEEQASQCIENQKKSMYAVIYKVDPNFSQPLVGCYETILLQKQAREILISFRAMSKDLHFK